MPSNNHSKIQIIIISIAIVIIWVIILCAHTQLTNMQLDNFTFQASKYQNALDTLELGTYQEYYEQLKEDTLSIIRNKDLTHISANLEDYALLYQTVTGTPLIPGQTISGGTTSELNPANQSLPYKNPSTLLSPGDNSQRQLQANENLLVRLAQVDVSQYPCVKLYVDIRDKTTNEVAKGLDPSSFLVLEQEATGNNFTQTALEQVIQLSHAEKLNVNLVADISNSMNGAPLTEAQSIMRTFLDTIEFNVGDTMELNLFSNGVFTVQNFTNDKQALLSQINNLYTQDMTSLYDALYIAVKHTALQDGAKCIIAFTDGKDNHSKCTPSEVITLAKRYNIPIFIMGIGNDLDSTVLHEIATQTNGSYTPIAKINDMGQIYDTIYHDQKELYLLQYELDETNDDLDTHHIKIEVQDEDLNGSCYSEYNPKSLLSAP